MPCFMVVGLQSTIASLGFKCVRGAIRRLDVGLGGLVTFMTASLGALCPPWQGGDVSRMPRGRVVLWSWRSRNVHDCSLGALYPGRQGGGVSRMPGGRGTPATDSSSTTESHY